MTSSGGSSGDGRAPTADRISDPTVTLDSVQDRTRPIDQFSADATDTDGDTVVRSSGLQGPGAAAGKQATSPVSDRLSLGEGTVVGGRYVLKGLAGSGGMAEVFRARDRKANRDVAIKILKQTFLDNPAAIEALEREARHAAAIDAQGIVPVFATGTDNGRPYTVMEFVDGKPLSQILKTREGRSVTWARTLDFAVDVGRTLAAAHAKGIVHCDLKPGNLFRMADGSWRVMDFGAALEVRDLRRDAQPVRVHRRLSADRSLEALTPAYASPEQLRHMAPEVRDDVFSLAVITYEMLTGLHPFGRLSADAAQERHMTPPRPAGIPPQAWNTLRRGLAFDRNKRPKSMTAFLRGLCRRRPVWPLTLLVLTISMGGAAALNPEVANRVLRDLELGGRAGMAMVQSDERAVAAMLDLKAADGPLADLALAFSRPLMEDRLRSLAAVGPEATTERLRVAMWAAGAARTLYPDDAAIGQLGERSFHLLLLDLADRLGRDEPIPRALLAGDVTLLRAGDPTAYAGVEDVIADLVRERLRKLGDPDAARSLADTARDLFPDEDWAEPPSGETDLQPAVPPGQKPPENTVPENVPRAAPVKDLQSQPLAPPPQ